LRPLRAYPASQLRPVRSREGRSARRGVPRAAAGRHRAGRAPLPPRAARGRAAASRVRRRGARARRGDRRGRPPDRTGPDRASVATQTHESPLPAVADKAHAVEEMFDRIAPRYDVLNRVLTLRMDVRWRRAAVRSLRLPAGAPVLDLACGTGDLCRALGDAGYRPVGADFSAGMLAAARTDAP